MILPRKSNGREDTSAGFGEENGDSTPVVEGKMEKTMEHEMEAGLVKGLHEGIMQCKGLNPCYPCTMNVTVVYLP